MTDDTHNENLDDDAREIPNEPEIVRHESHGQRVVYVPLEQWLDHAAALRSDGFEVCVDLCGVDHLLNRGRPVPDGVQAERFEVVANFLSMSRNERLRAVCEVPGDDATIASITSVYPGVDYSERETYDLFGIVFEGHPDLTRILLPEDWEGWPLRKDDAAARVPVQFKGNATTPDQQSLRASADRRFAPGGRRQSGQAEPAQETATRREANASERHSGGQS